jgi:transcriptional regulator with XRE-family HTH domain
VTFTDRRPGLDRVFTFNEIREWVLEARRRLMMAGPDVADFLGISPSRVNEIERGEKPNMLPPTRKKITERILAEDPTWIPARKSFPPLEHQLHLPEKAGPSGMGDELDTGGINMGQAEGLGSPTFSESPASELTSPDSEDLVRPKISGQMIAIEVDEDDLFEITIQVRRKKQG